MEETRQVSALPISHAIGTSKTFKAAFKENLKSFLSIAITQKHRGQNGNSSTPPENASTISSHR